MKTRRLHFTRLAALALALSFTPACDDDETPTEPTTGDLRIATQTTGGDLDPDGYSASVDGAAGVAIGVNDEITVSDLSPGSHTVQLGGLAGNCAVTGENPRTVSVTAGATAQATFVLACPLDFGGATTDLGNVFSEFFEGNDAALSLSFFAENIMLALGGGVPVNAPLDVASGLLGVAPGVRAALGELGPAPSGSALIPVGALGTWEWNEATTQYEKTSDLPDDRARFILYEVDPITGTPTDPLTEIGWLDIIDTSSFPTVNITLEAVVDGLTLVDVTVTGTFTETTVDLNFAGFFANADGSEQLDFTLSLVGTETSFDIVFGLTAGAYTVSFTVDVAADGSVSATLLITGPDDPITFSFDVDTNDNVTGEVQVGETTLALISGTIDDPIVTNAEGNPLTPEELAALEEILMILVELADVFFSIVEFALLLIGLGTV